MNSLAPLPQSNTRADRARNPYENRWRWWYTAIADFYIRNPTGTIKECAKEIGRGETTISFIQTTDMYRQYFAQRKAEWTQQHDYSIRNKVTRIAEASLDLLLDKIDKKGDQLPPLFVKDLAMSSLEKLGYGAKEGPTVQINNHNGPQQIVVAPASLDELEQARAALRNAEQVRRLSPPGQSNQSEGVVDAEVIEGSPQGASVE